MPLPAELRRIRRRIQREESARLAPAPVPLQPSRQPSPEPVPGASAFGDDEKIGNLEGVFVNFQVEDDAEFQESRRENFRAAVLKHNLTHDAIEDIMKAIDLPEFPKSAKGQFRSGICKNLKSLFGYLLLLLPLCFSFAKARCLVVPSWQVLFVLLLRLKFIGWIHFYETVVSQLYITRET